MPQFELFSVLKWAHLVCFSLGAGAAMVVLVLAGFEDSREDLKGLTSVLWKRTAAWGFRFAFLLGLILLGLKIRAGVHPFAESYLHLKLALAFLLLMFSEMSPRALGAAKRGAPLLALILFLLVTFVSVNKVAFNGKRRVESSFPVAGALESNR